MKTMLAQIEARLQSLIEGSAARLFPSGSRENDLAARMVAALRTGIWPGPDGQPLSPNLFTLHVHPRQLPAMQANLPLLDSLTYTLRESAREAGLEFPSPPVIRVAADPELRPGEIRVEAENSLHGLTDTTDIDVTPSEGTERVPPNAFLIVDGTQIFPLTQTVVNIGRRLDNQLVIDDARVSRAHAQLRAVRGRYVIFDLNSTGGTFVNGESIRQYALQPGDVISLSGVPLVYGQDPADEGGTQDLRSKDGAAGPGSEPEEIG